MKFNKHIKLLFFVGIIIIIYSCAKQVAVSGGPKDITPPVMIEATPQNGSVNFNSKVIYIKFDEYIKLNNINQKLITSPPIDEAPVITIKGKGVKISLNPELLDDNTTYSLNFNDAIADNNENNALHSFVYAFSTGPQIDSLSFSGSVIDAFTRKPVDDVWVILHDVFADSAIKTYNPAYLTKVDKDGKFLIPFVRENNYRIFALRDNNFNFLFDLPDEGIAFLDSIFTPGVEAISITDTTGQTTNKYNNYPAKIELLVFTENNQAQFINSLNRYKPDYMEFTFNSTQYTEFDVIVNEDENAIIYAKENPDTVKIWLQKKDVIDSDSVTVFVNFRDPIYTDTLRLDTLIFRKPENIYGDSLIHLSVNKTKEPHKELNLILSAPVKDINSKLLKLEFLSDSVYLPTEFTLKADTNHPLKIIIDAEFLEKTDYRIIVENGFISHSFGLSNFTDTLEFSTTSSVEYGNLLINFPDPDKKYIVQLLKSDVVVAEINSIKGITDFQFIKPATYRLRVIEDKNGNLRWDTGNFDNHVQPEPIYYYPGEYEIRSNWNHELDWNPINDLNK